MAGSPIFMSRYTHTDEAKKYFVTLDLAAASTVFRFTNIEFRMISVSALWINPMAPMSGAVGDHSGRLVSAHEKLHSVTFWTHCVDDAVA